MKVASETEMETTVAARIAGEDISCGDFVTVMNKVVELPSFLWSCSGSVLAPDEPVRIRIVAEDAGQPYKVMGVCLPFVYTKKHDGTVVIHDTRQRQLARLDRDCAKVVWKELKNKTENKFRF